MDYSPPGSSVHGILQARILEWVAMPFSRGSSQSRDRTQVSCIAGGFFSIWTTREAQEYWSWVAYPFSRESSQPRNQTGFPALQVDSLPAELVGKPILVSGEQHNDSIFVYTIKCHCTVHYIPWLFLTPFTCFDHPTPCYWQTPASFLYQWICCCFYMCVCSIFFQLFATLWTVVCLAPLSMEFSRQEY